MSDGIRVGKKRQILTCGLGCGLGRHGGLARLSTALLLGFLPHYAGAHGIESERDRDATTRRMVSALQVGQVSLDVVRHIQLVDIELRSRALDVMGFDGLPKTNAEQQRWSVAMDLLLNPNALWTFNAEAKCQAVDTRVDSPLLLHYAHTKRVPLKMHPDPPKPDPVSAGVSHGEHTESHAFFQGRYRFQCDKPAALKWLDIMIFDQFPLLHQATTTLRSATSFAPMQYKSLSGASNRMRF
ncbi:MAG: DUF2796 domain-containing protein [Gammaproteobacteria bacterium]